MAKKKPSKKAPPFSKATPNLMPDKMPGGKTTHKGKGTKK